jgi:hypothetical protein
VAVDFEASATCEKSSSQSEAMTRCTEALPARVPFLSVTFLWGKQRKVTPTAGATRLQAKPVLARRRRSVQKEDLNKEKNLFGRN